MQLKIECTSSQNEIFLAHMLDETKNIINYKCGICSYGDLIFDKKKKIIYNIKNNKCNLCKSPIKIIEEVES